MKLWATFFVCLFGTALASFEDVLDEARDETLNELHRVLASLPSLNGDVDGISLQWMDSEIKSEFGKLLKHTLDEAIAAIKDALAHGKKISVEWIDRIKALKETLKGFGKDVEQKVKDLLEELKTQRSEEEVMAMVEAPGGRRKFSAVATVLALLKKQIARKVAPEFIIKFIDKVKSILGDVRDSIF